jgi:hypothetical protein
MRGSISVQLIQLAQRAAENEQQRIETLSKELQEAEERVANLSAALTSAKSAVGRLDEFEPQLGGEYQCPYCWVIRSVEAEITPIPGETNVDWFRCKTCDREISIE